MNIFSEATTFFSQIKISLPSFIEPVIKAVKDKDVAQCISFSKKTLPAYYKCFLLLKRLVLDVEGKDFDLAMINSKFNERSKML